MKERTEEQAKKLKEPKLPSWQSSLRKFEKARSMQLTANEVDNTSIYTFYLKMRSSDCGLVTILQRYSIGKTRLFLRFSSIRSLQSGH